MPTYRYDRPPCRHQTSEILFLFLLFLPPWRTIIPAANQTRILFLARRYPPSVGGVQTHCYRLYTQLSTTHPVKLVALGRQSLLHLLWFLPYAFVYSFLAVLLRRYDVIYFSDGVVGFFAPILRPFSRARFVITIYGLELTYKNPVARRLMRLGARACDRVAVISQITRDITAQAGVNPDKIVIIYVGVEPLSLSDERCAQLRQQFEEQHNLCFGRDRLLLNFSRMIPRKGIVPFVERGLPLLQEDIRLIISDHGDERQRLLETRQRLGLQDRILTLGRADDEIIAMLRQSADLFIMPNIAIPNDVEGYGMANLECMYSGLPAVAFAVDALVESNREGGYLIDPENYQAFADHIHHYFALSPVEKAEMKDQARAYVRREYSWKKTAQQYLDVFEGRM